MTLEHYAYVAEIVGAIGIIVTLAYLAAQIRQGIQFVAVLKSHGATGWYENIKPILPSDLVERLEVLLKTYDGPAVTETLDYLAPDA